MNRKKSDNQRVERRQVEKIEPVKKLCRSVSSSARILELGNTEKQNVVKAIHKSKMNAEAERTIRTVRYCMVYTGIKYKYSRYL